MSTKTKFDIIFNMKTFAETYKEEAYRQAKEKAIESIECYKCGDVFFSKNFLFDNQTVTNYL